MEYIDINEYIKQSKVVRQQHLALTTSCVEIGGGSQEFRGLLAHYLNTTIPKGFKVLLCHACNNGRCSNVVHLYWGTPKENMSDAGTLSYKGMPRRSMGMPSTHNKNTRWITNGTVNKRIKGMKPLPFGFRFGRTCRLEKRWQRST